MNKLLLTSFIIAYFFTQSYAQIHKISKSINWEEKDTIFTSDKRVNCILEEGNYKSKENFTNATGQIQNITYAATTLQEQSVINCPDLSNEIKLQVSVFFENNKPVVSYSFMPFRINLETNQLERVIKYDILIKTNGFRNYASTSLLASGNWHKIKVDTTGIFSLTYSELISIGLSKPENARVYTYGGKQLPYANSDINYDDLQEIPVKLFKGDDGIFNTGDFLIFYAEGTTTWHYDDELGMFMHSKHNFSNFTYLFITDDMGIGGLKIAEIDNSKLSSNYSSSSFDSYSSYESNSTNLIQSGRTWYSDRFTPGTSVTLKFKFPNLIGSEPTKVYSRIAGRKQKGNESCYFSISQNNNQIGRINIDSEYAHYVYGYEYSKLFEIKNTDLNLELKYLFDGVNPSMLGYIDFVCVNVRENLKMQTSQLLFRDVRSIDSTRITQFNINTAGKNIFVWNVTDALHPYELKLSNQNSTSSFKAETNSLQQFISFEAANFFTPIITKEVVQNQNLHGVKSHDMIIITHPDFQKQAETLAELHRNNDNLSVYVTQPELIYNEFSSGTPDISAIRNFLRMLYDRAPIGQEPKYLLLLGDGSYDNWTIGAPNSNFIPTYQSLTSLVETTSFVSDDYYGLLDLGEGEIMTSGLSKMEGLLDIGIGRLPVQTAEEADLMVEKIKHYTSPKSFGSWKTNICFIGDDDDSGMHMTQPESIDRDIIKILNPEYNVNKIYLDAYKQTSTPSGQRFADITRIINDQVASGALIIDYVGHGNPRILAHEQILDVPDVMAWKNWDKLPIFVTASCEVGRYDDYKQTSLGESFLLNPNGGGIAALTTTRVVYSTGNANLNSSFFRNALKPDLRFGDVVRNAKNDQGATGTNHRNFSLLGDPALRISVPKNKIVVGNINNNFLPLPESVSILKGNDIEKTVSYAPGDTVFALSKARVEGYIDDANGNPLNEDGILYISIYDKMDTLHTYGQDNASVEFIIQNNILYKGKASIKKGYFSFDFIVPKDINYKFGNGKISLYAVLDTSEAIGYSENIVIGGNALSSDFDYDGPNIGLFMNDTTFVNGGLTNENPVFIATLNDENGINTAGIGFGHNITAILDGNQDNIYMLNAFYEGDLDKYNSGRVRYPFTNLTAGYHNITFKAWDVYNNSREFSLEFYVKESSLTVIENLKNSPNPFSEITYFTFDHNQSFDDLNYDAFDITIQIFDIMGNKVTQINQKNSSAGYAIEPILWNGTNASGAKLPKGVYIYRTEISDAGGKKTSKSSKLMIF